LIYIYICEKWKSRVSLNSILLFFGEIIYLNSKNNGTDDSNSTYFAPHAETELGLFIRGVKINITRYNICSVVIVETGRVKIS